MSDKTVMKPEVIVFAGPNGSGKSTVTRMAKTVGRYINADEIKRATFCSDLEAAQKAEQLREKLSENASLCVLQPVTVQVSRLDGTRKYLFRLPDGNCIESVFMRYHHGNSVCISSQAGCRMGCRFCASTIGGLSRSLTAGEMLDQIYRITEETGERVSNVVIMGSGEPMDNYDNIVRFIRMISGEEGMNLSQRNITVSTCGIVPKMREFAEEGLQVTLALSLHAADDETRKELMPIANRYTIKEALDASPFAEEPLEWLGFDR